MVNAVSFQFAGNKLWQIESNALDTSIATTATSFLLPGANHQLALIKRNSKNAHAGTLTLSEKTSMNTLYN